MTDFTDQVFKFVMCIKMIDTTNHTLINSFPDKGICSLFYNSSQTWLQCKQTCAWEGGAAAKCASLSGTTRSSSSRLQFSFLFYRICFVNTCVCHKSTCNPSFLMSTWLHTWHVLLSSWLCLFCSLCFGKLTLWLAIVSHQVLKHIWHAQTFSVLSPQTNQDFINTEHVLHLQFPFRLALIFLWDSQER